MLVIPMCGVRGNGAGGGGFDPLSLSPAYLFNAGPSWCFQDAAGTVPCGDGDPVYRWNDRSGNGVTLTQATLADRPTLKLVSGKWLVESGSTGGMNGSSGLPLIVDRYVGQIFLADDLAADTRMSRANYVGFGRQTGHANEVRIIIDTVTWGATGYSTVGFTGVSKPWRQYADFVGGGVGNVVSFLFDTDFDAAVLSHFGTAPAANDALDIQYGPRQSACMIGFTAALSAPNMALVKQYLIDCLP